MPADPLAGTGDLLTDAGRIGSVILDALRDGLRDAGLIGLRPALELSRRDLELTVLAILGEVAERFQAEPAAGRDGEEHPEPPPGRRLLIRFIEGYGSDGWDGVVERVEAAAEEELRTAVIGSMEESYRQLLRDLSEGDGS
jgi:hypothetical protein